MRAVSRFGVEMVQTKSIRQGTGESKGWERSLVAATLLTCAVALSASMADPDLWGHVQYGRDALRDGLPVTTTHSYTALNYPWINHENLAELLLAMGADLLGPVGMLVCKCLLGVGVIALILWNGRRQGASMLACCLVAMLVAVNLSYFWSLRPQLLSFLWYALMLALLLLVFHGLGRRLPSALVVSLRAAASCSPASWKLTIGVSCGYGWAPAY